MNKVVVANFARRSYSGGGARAIVMVLFPISINALLSSLKAKDEVLRLLVAAQPQMLREVTQLSAAVNKATHHRNNMTINAVVRRSK